MKLLCAFTPFHTPTSPPLGLACLKAALSAARRDVTIQVADWNLAFFRRWLLGRPPHLCAAHPHHLLGEVCPNLLVAGGQGGELWDALARVPVSGAEAGRYMTAAKLLDDVFRTLANWYRGLLWSCVEGKADLPKDVADQLFAEEFAQIEAEQPDVLGFSILSEQSLLYALVLGRAAQERFGMSVALGGAMMSHLDAGELLRAFPWVDYVFVGEAEASIVAFADARGSGRDASLEEVAGLAHRRADGAPCVHGPGEPPNLAALPFADFSDFTLRDYLVAEPVLPVFTCRGCYWGKCTFCSHTRPHAPGMRLRGAVRVVDELEHQMREHGARRFLFVDEAISPKVLRDLTEEIQGRKLDIRWGAEGIRVERAFDVSLLARAHRAGLRWVYVGVESGSQHVLDLIEKGTDVATIRSFVRLCHELGIVPQLSFILGIPGATREDLARDAEWFGEYPLDASPFALLLGSPMQQRAADFGIRVEDQEVIFDTVRGPLHAPRFHFTLDGAPSPQAATDLIEQSAAGSRRRMRPHLGEIHATLLADTDFFSSDARPPDPEPAAARALARLRAQTPRGEQWTIHAIGCAEALGDFQGAMEILQEALNTTVASPFDQRLLVHLAALYNQADRPDLALADQADLGSPAGPALRGQLVRACAALDRADGVVEHAVPMLAAGYEIPGAYYLLGHSLEATGRIDEALQAYRAAEMRDWPEPEINLAQARCLRAMKRPRQARSQEQKARRKAAP